jgi:hypothetical protein
VPVALLAYLLTQYGYAWRVPFINDDFIFLDLTRAMPFASVWAPHDMWVGLYYRPWSRELYYWALQRLSGASEAPFHAVSFGLWLGIALLYFALVRRLAGAKAAAVATAGMAALAAWGVPVVWVAGAQELWMLLFALTSLVGFAKGADALATLAFLLALLSKETAAVVPGVAFLLLVLPGRQRPLDALRRLGPSLAVTAAWAALHPQLGGRLWHAAGAPGQPLGPGPAGVVAHTLLATVNLDAVPRPEFGWVVPMAVGVVGAVCLAVFVALVGAAPEDDRSTRAPAAGSSTGRLAAFAAAWALFGWLPLLMPTVGWHPYYGLLGMLGAWLLPGVLLARRRSLALVVVTVVALLRSLQAATVSRDWGDEYYQRRATEFLNVMRADLLAKVPTVPSHSRFYFVDVPSSVGFLQGDGPALRVWYGDPTLSGGLFSDYRVRGPGDPQGPDRFFRFDSTVAWIEVRAGGEDVTVARAADPRWREDHERLAIALSRGEDWPRAAAEYSKLASTFPDSINYVYYAGLAALVVGDSAGGRAWLERALRLPDCDDEIRAAARRVGAGAAPGTGR